MAYLGSKSFGELQEKEKVILPFDEKRLKSGAYELSLGSEVFRTDSKDNKKEILKEKKEQVIINPGQFALLLTEEEVSIPTDKIAFISIKAGIKLRGLVNVSGFHVDPGFNGKLVFSVYNAGSSQISLERGEPSFLIWLANLSEKEIIPYNGEHKNQDSIPLKYIDALTNKTGELASPNVLLKKINDNYTALEGKINVVDERKKIIDYVVKAFLGILIVIALKLLVDWSEYNRGLKDGYEKKSFEISVDSTKQNLRNDMNALKTEVQSLKILKQKIQKTDTIK